MMTSTHIQPKIMFCLMRISFPAEQICLCLSTCGFNQPLGQSRFPVASEDHHGGGLEIPDDGSCLAMTERDCASPTPSLVYPDNQVGLYDTPESLVQ